MATQAKSGIDLDDLTRNLVENIENVLNLLGIEEYNVYPNRIAFPCPIHGGDNPEGCSIFTDGEKTLGNWVCWTHACHQKTFESSGGMESIGRDIFGFIRGVLSKTDIPRPYSSAIAWSIKALKSEVKPLNRFSVPQKKIVKKKELVKIVGTVGRDTIRSYLQIPCNYYLNTKYPYSKEILDKYDIGLSNIPRSKMYLRAVTPVYDDNFKFVGACGRNTQPKCEKCNMYHFANRPCPTNKIEKKWARKWINSTGIWASNVLYNTWYAIPHIYKNGTVILVEGSGDVWRLEESGIHIALGMFKTCLTPQQVQIIKSMPISNVIIATDNDEAGREGGEKVANNLKEHFNIYKVTPDSDWGASKPEEIWDKFSPVFRKIGIYEETSCINLR